MAKFEVLYSMAIPRQGLDSVIEADIYRVSGGKFFEFLVDKEIVRTLRCDIVVQIKRVEQ
jgi:hypothetical protein